MTSVIINLTRKRIVRIICVFALAVVFLSAGLGTAYAYFDRGPVGLSVSQGAVSMTSGEGYMVSVSVSPAADEQLPGCGMAECPQTCGDLGCLDARGQCTCAGTTYSTYYPTVSASSSNSSVAAVSYANGALSITGISPGSATITIYASLRQFTDSQAYVQVTVNAPPQPVNPNPPPSNNNNNSTDGNNNSETTTVVNNGTPNNGITSVGGNNSAVANNDSGKTPVQGSSSNSNDGITQLGDGVSRIVAHDGVAYTTADLSRNINIAELLSNARGMNETVTFQQKDSSGNVQYSLSFFGGDINENVNVDLRARITDELPEGINTSSDSMTLKFDTHHDLPGTAEVYVAVGNRLIGTPSAASTGEDTQTPVVGAGLFAPIKAYAASAGNTPIDVYQVDPGTGEPVLIATEGRVTNGYMVFDINNTNDVILVVSGGLSSAAGGVIGGVTDMQILIGVIIIVVIVVVVIIAVQANKKKRRRSRDSSDNQSLFDDDDRNNGRDDNSIVDNSDSDAGDSPDSDDNEKVEAVND